MSDPVLFCAVKVQGQELTDYVMRLEVEESDSRADRARIVFGDSQLVLCDVLHEGLSVEIDLGHTDEHAVVFRGVATSVTCVFPPAGSPTVELVAEDSLIQLALQPRTKRWSNTSVSAIVQQLAAANGLVPGTIAPGDDVVFGEHYPAQQVAETDLAFLERLARLSDSKLWVDHSEAVDSLNLLSTQRLLAADPLQQSLEFNSTLVDFRASFDSWAADPEEHLVSTDPDSGARVAVDETLSQGSDTTWTPDPARIARLGDGATRIAALLTSAAPVRAQLTQYLRIPERAAGVPARAASDRSGVRGDRLRRRGQTGRGRASGSIWLRPRARVEIVGYGGRWSGTWYLARVHHHLDLLARNYVSTFVSVR